VLIKADNRLRKAIISNSNSDLVKTIVEIVLNTLKGNYKVTKSRLVNIPEDMNNDWKVGISDIYLNNYIKYAPNQDKNVVEETEFVSLVNAETFRYKNVSV